MAADRKNEEGCKDMARYTGPRNKLTRREGVELFNKQKSVLERRSAPPGQQATRGRRKVSPYGVRLREKQKVKRLYGVLERQFSRYMREARKAKGQTGALLLQILERRLDNTVYRLGLAKTRPFARQLVTHGHVIVNNKKVDIPSYSVSVGDVITLKPKVLENPDIKLLLQDPPTTPEWLSKKGPVGKVERLPERDDVLMDIDEQLIVEYYSR